MSSKRSQPDGTGPSDQPPKKKAFMLSEPVNLGAISTEVCLLILRIFFCYTMYEISVINNNILHEILSQ